VYLLARKKTGPVFKAAKVVFSAGMAKRKMKALIVILLNVFLATKARRHHLYRREGGKAFVIFKINIL
jgi:hypothetical protein